MQAEDEEFARALVSPALMRCLLGSQLAETFAFAFDHGTLSTRNHADVVGPDGSAYPLDYLSMMIDYPVQIVKVSPPELWRD